jgi:Ca2+-binding EF-hand superfamily protein
MSKLQKQLAEEQAHAAGVEQANEDLRRKLQASLAAMNRLHRRIEMQNIDAGGDFQDVEVEEGEEAAPKAEGATEAPLISSEMVQDSMVVPRFSRHDRGGGPARVDTMPYFNVLQKLTQVTDKIANVLATSSTQAMLPESSTEETDKVMLSGNTTLMIRAIQMKANEALQYAECLDNADLVGAAQNPAVAQALLPRFMQYIKAHHQETATKAFQRVTSAAVFQVRQIFNAKLLSDKINFRMGRRLCRFPEFVIGFFGRDGENLFTSLSRSARLWRAVEGSKVPEVELFRNFLLEKLTVDELSFFVEARHSLIGQRTLTEDDPVICSVPYARCLDFVTAALGAFSPVLAAVSQEAEKQAANGYIDYAMFLSILMTYYQNERKRRRKAVRLMFQSKNVEPGQVIDFEGFLSIVQTLGFQGSNDEVFALFREANLFGAGIMTLDSFLKAMDSLSFHFYSIEVPMTGAHKNELTKLSRQQLTQHWQRFSSWFNAFRQPIPTFDPWLRSTMVTRVRRCEQLFKNHSAVPSLYSEYRQLLDFFQFALDVMARSQREPMGAQKSERHLALLENTVDLLVTFVLKDCGADIVFTEVT